MGKLRCGCVVRRIKAIEDRIMNRPTRFFQTFYLVLILGLFGGVVYWGFPLSPNALVPEVHKVGLLVGVVVGLLVWVRVSFFDPGFVGPGAEPSYALDFVLYDGKACTTCKLSRPARSKHCRVCGRCVARFDHHCVWMNNCIGEGNYRWFLLYLIHHSLLCFYGSWFAIASAYLDINLQIAAVRRQQGMSGFVPTFEMMTGFILTHYTGLFITTVLMLVVAFMLLAFFLYHVSLVSRNITTNESFKWGDVKDTLQVAFETHESMPSEAERPDAPIIATFIELGIDVAEVGCFRSTSLKAPPRQRRGSGAAAAAGKAKGKGARGQGQGDDAGPIDPHHPHHQQEKQPSSRDTLVSAPATDPAVAEIFRGYAYGKISTSKLNLYNLGFFGNWLEVLTGKPPRTRDGWVLAAHHAAKSKEIKSE